VAKRLGEILIEQNLITEKQLQKALALQTQRKGLLGRILVQENYVSQEDVVAALVRQCRIPHLKLTQLDIDQGVISLVPQEFIRNKLILPVDRLGSILTVAMVDPMDFDTIDQLRELCGLRVKPIVCTYDDLDEAIHKYLGPPMEEELGLPCETPSEHQDPFPPDAEQTFEQLQITSDNEIIISAARAASESLEVSCSPLLLRGPMGSGKSHLLHAMGNRIKEIKPSSSVALIEAEHLVREFERAVAEGTHEVLMEQLAQKECLLVDNVDILLELPMAAQTLLSLLDRFSSEGKQVVLTTSSSIAELDKAAPGLGERLAAGAALDLPAPSLDVAMRITRQRAEEKGMMLDDSIVMLTLQEGHNNPGWALDTLKKIVRYAQVIEQEPSIDLAGEVLRTLKRTEEGMKRADSDKGHGSDSVPDRGFETTTELTMEEAKTILVSIRNELKDALEGGAKQASKPILLNLRTSYKELDEHFRKRDLQALQEGIGKVRSALNEAIQDAPAREKVQNMIPRLEKGIAELRRIDSPLVGDLAGALADIKSQWSSGDQPSVPLLTMLEDLGSKIESEKDVIETEGKRIKDSQADLRAKLDHLKEWASDLSAELEDEAFFRASGAIDSGDIEFATGLLDQLQESIRSIHQREVDTLHRRAREAIDEVKDSSLANQFESEIQEVEALLASLSGDKERSDLPVLRRAFDLGSSILESVSERLLPEEIEPLETPTSPGPEDKSHFHPSLETRMEEVSREIEQLSEYSLNDEEYTQIEHMKVSLEDLLDTKPEDFDKAERRLQDLSAMASDLKEVIEERMGHHKEAEAAVETAKEALLDSISEGADVGNLQEKLRELEDLAARGQVAEAQALAKTIIMAARQATEESIRASQSPVDMTVVGPESRAESSSKVSISDLESRRKTLRSQRDTVSEIVDRAMDMDLSDEASDSIRATLALIEKGDQAVSVEELDPILSDLSESIRNLNALLAVSTAEVPISSKEEPEHPQKRKPASSELPRRFSKPDSKYTFENFFIGRESQFTCTAARSLALSPGEVYNPFFVFGMPGSGKTHLLHAIGNAGLDINPSTLICCVSWPELRDQILVALDEDKIEEFCLEFENFRFLLIDDLQFEDDDDVEDQEWLVHILERIREQENQIVITGRHAPKRLPHLTQGLLKYLEEGIVTALSPLSLVDKTMKLKHLCDEKDIELPENVLERLATMLTNKLETFEPSLLRFVAYLKSKGKVKEEDLTEEAIREILDANE